jgi:hypothetical protein
MSRVALLVVVSALLVLAGCTIDVPFGAPTGDDLFSGIQSRLENLLEDPLRTHPFPVLVGGDDEHVYYATSLTDVRINFRGPTNDVVIPGFLGPSNLYVYQGGKRELLRELVPAGAATGLTTDGRFLVYFRFSGLDMAFPEYQVVASSLGDGTENVIFDSADAETETLSPTLTALAGGRVALALSRTDAAASTIRVVDLTGLEAVREIELPGLYVDSLALTTDYLAYASTDSLLTSIVLYDLRTDAPLTVASEIRDCYGPRVFLTANMLVWSEPPEAGPAPVKAYDLAAGATRLWTESTAGELVGASDSWLVTEEWVYNDSTGAERIAVHRYDQDGGHTKLAEFRADGLAGQTCIIGDYAAWVNPDRQVVLAPLAGGSRKIFQPF